MKTALEIALERSQKIWEVTTPEELSNIELQKEVGQIVSKHLKGEMTVAQMIKYVIERENADDMLRNIH